MGCVKSKQNPYGTSVDLKKYRPEFINPQVVRVIDGDTVEIKFRPHKNVKDYSLISARLHGIDTPETRISKTIEEKMCGVRAKRVLEQICKTYTVEVEILEKSDKYSRPLATLIYNKININEWMVTNGLAVSYKGNKKMSFRESFPVDTPFKAPFYIFAGKRIIINEV